MSHYLELESHVTDKVNVVLDLSNFATKKKLNDAAGVDTSNLAAKRYLIALKAEGDKLSIKKLVNAPTGLSNLKAKVDDLDVGKLKTVPVDLSNLSHVMGKEVVTNTKFNKLNTKVNNSEKKSLMRLL